MKSLKLSFPLVGNLSGFGQKDAGQAGMTRKRNCLSLSEINKTIFLLLLLLVWPSQSSAQLDLDQEVMVVPDTHNEKPYIWHVERTPGGYELVLSGNGAKAGEGPNYVFRIISPSGIRPENVHVFITDGDLHAYAHRKAVRTGDDYLFSYDAPRPGKYRLEVVFEATRGWINLSKNIKIGGPARGTAADEPPGDEDYEVNIKLIPKKAYAEHVVTFLYEILYKGKPLRDLEKLDGFDMQVAAWDEDLKEFIYATPRQNLGGPEVAVSFVFMRPGKHAVFAEFKHRGVVRRIDSVVLVHQESLHDKGAIENLRTAD